MGTRSENKESADYADYTEQISHENAQDAQKRSDSPFDLRVVFRAFCASLWRILESVKSAKSADHI